MVDFDAVKVMLESAVLAISVESDSGGSIDSLARSGNSFEILLYTEFGIALDSDSESPSAVDSM